MVEAPLVPTTAFGPSPAPWRRSPTEAPSSRSRFPALPCFPGITTRPSRRLRSISVVNAADGTKPVAPGGLISVYGQQMSPVNIATQQIPLPTALGESCLTVNGVAVPMLFVSGQQINGQLPANVNGNATMALYTPGGISNNFYFSISARGSQHLPQRDGGAGDRARHHLSQRQRPAHHAHQSHPPRRYHHHLRHRHGPYFAVRGFRDCPRPPFHCPIP